MSQIENDLNEDTYIGIEFPLDHNRAGFFRRTKTALKQSSSNIKNLLLTRKGERVGNPEFGSDLMNVLFDIEGEDLENKIEESIRSSISEFLPFISISEIDINFSDSNRNRVNIKLRFSLNTDETTIEELEITTPTLVN